MSLVTGGWGLLYAMYRGYYGLGGTAGWMNLGRSPARRWTGTALAAIAVLTAIVDRNDHGCCAAAVFGSLLYALQRGTGHAPSHALGPGL